MTKKILAFLLAVVMTVCITGCTGPREVWVSESVVQESDNGKTTRTKRTTTDKDSKQTTGKTGVGTRETRDEGDMLKFDKVADAGANYDVKGEVSIAVDTVRSTDYEAMFDILQKLYPNIKFKFDYWTHQTNDDGREYLKTRMNTGTAANIMWDEAGMLPTYLSNGWIEPITSLVNKDPEAKNIPANLKNDYTFFGELYAVPHQATFEVTVFNTDLLKKLNLDMPKLEWSYADYEKYQRAAGDGFNKGICVAVEDQTAGPAAQLGNRVAVYLASEAGKKLGTNAYNYSTKKFETEYLKKGYQQVRAYRLLPGAEAWELHRQQQENGGENLLQQKLGVANYYDCWRTGKALIKNCGTWIVETTMKNQKNFNWKMWTTPNKGGQMMVHVDHCFIVRGSKGLAENKEACYQALRFMTFTTNGNLARLLQYDDAEKGKYNLNSHVYYPTTTNATVIKKFNDLKCTTEVDEYLVKNIPNSSRNDTFKLVYAIQDVYSAESDWTQKMNDITDGLDPSGGNLNEPIEKANKQVAENLAQFEKEYKKAYKK